VIITHRNGSYEIKFRALSDALANLPEDGRVITDELVAASLSLGERISIPVFGLPPGEGSKSIEAFEKCLNWLANSGASRKTSVIALGGGVIGDLAGYLAASYMRGVPFIQVPTTLLAQVDSSVGGKVGIDLAAGKNLAGAFYPPSRVEICPDALSTLPGRQIRNGMAEVLKYGFIMDAPLLELCGPSDFDRNSGELVRRCIDLKRQVVEADEFETNGTRATLNFGHTIGHALEQMTGYGPLLHGEAISIGMIAEARLGERLEITEGGTSDQVAGFLRAWDLPDHHPLLAEAGPMLAAMRRDKKAHGGRLAFSLLTKIGECKLVTDLHDQDVVEALKST
jgi:3-dehydroquinate synthase